MRNLILLFFAVSLFILLFSSCRTAKQAKEYSHKYQEQPAPVKDEKHKGEIIR